MRVTEQIDALDIMGINSSNYLIFPKISAAILINPVLIIISMGFGLFGGYMVAIFTNLYSVPDYLLGVKSWFDSGSVELLLHQYEALQDVDAMVLVTEWKPFRTSDFHVMKKMMKTAVIFDGWNQYDPASEKLEDFEYWGIGR